MADDNEREKLEAMTSRIHAAEGKADDIRKLDEDSATVKPFKMSGIGFDFVGAILVCTFLGWLADKYLHTSPWGLIGMIVIGFGVGITNVWRSMANTRE